MPETLEKVSCGYSDNNEVMNMNDILARGVFFISVTHLYSIFICNNMSVIFIEHTQTFFRTDIINLRVSKPLGIHDSETHFHWNTFIHTQ